MQKAMPLETNTGGMETVAYTYANYFLLRKITQTERTEILDGLSKRLPDIITSDGRKAMPVKLYTPQETPFLPDVKIWAQYIICMKCHLSSRTAK